MAKQTIYYSDPLQDDFAGNHIRGKVVDQNFPFLHRSRLWELGPSWCIMELQCLWYF